MVKVRGVKGKGQRVASRGKKVQEIEVDERE